MYNCSLFLQEIAPCLIRKVANCVSDVLMRIPGFW